MQHIQGSRGGPVSVRTHGSCAPGLCHRLRPLLGKSVTLRVETWPEASRNPLWGILWFSLLGIFTLCFEKTGVKKSYVSVLSRVRLFATLWTVPARLPCAWDLPGQNAGVGCHFLLQGIFPTQGANLYHLHRKQILYH